MAFVSNYSDRVNRAKLCSQGDMDILGSVGAASEFVVNANKRIEIIQGEMTAEQARKYPDAGYIARCVQKIADIRANITLYNLQRRK